MACLLAKIRALRCLAALLAQKSRRPQLSGTSATTLKSSRVPHWHQHTATSWDCDITEQDFRQLAVCSPTKLDPTLIIKRHSFLRNINCECVWKHVATPSHVNDLEISTHRCAWESHAHIVRKTEACWYRTCRYPLPALGDPSTLRCSEHTNSACLGKPSNLR